MPARPAPSDTTAPGLTRRRTWAHPELASHSLLALTFDKLYLAPPTGTPRPETLAAVEAGTDLDVVFGPLAVVIDLAAVRRVTLDLLANALVVEYAGAGGTVRQRVTFATPEAADGCFAKVWRRAGDRLQLTPYRRDAWALARPPLFLLLAALFVTALLVLARNVFEDSAPDRAAAGAESALSLALGGLDWRVVCAVGGAAAAVSQVWLYRRLTAPPAALELVRV